MDHQLHYLPLRGPERQRLGRGRAAVLTQHLVSISGKDTKQPLRQAFSYLVQLYIVALEELAHIRQ